MKGWEQTKVETEGVTLEIEITVDIVWDTGGNGQITFDKFWCVYYKYNNCNLKDDKQYVVEFMVSLKTITLVHTN